MLNVPCTDKCVDEGFEVRKGDASKEGSHHKRPASEEKWSEMN